MRVTIPERLVPYLQDMLRTGLYGNGLRDVVLRCIERDVQRAVGERFIPLRINGKVSRRWPPKL